jgi:hypothetical protein
MNWNYMPVVGTTGGILVEYCTMTIVRSKVDNFTWSLIVVYGSPYEETKKEFLDLLNYIMELWQGPTMVGEDFNLVRKQEEKSNGVINHHHVDIFNAWISNWALIEIKDPSRKFTWTNNQECPTMTTLDRRSWCLWTGRLSTQWLWLVYPQKGLVTIILS